MAGFDLREVPPKLDNLQYKKYNEFLLTWFNGALKNFPLDLAKDARHFPWSGAPISWQDFIYPRAVLNPFLGEFGFARTADAFPPGCDITENGNPSQCANTEMFRASRYLYPRQCSLGDLAGAAACNIANVARLRQCGLNYELHHNGYLEQWPTSFWPDARKAGMIANQYGRTSFLFAGVPGLQLPVSFYKDPNSDSGLSVYERVYNASIFSLYLPVTNVADVTRAFTAAIIPIKSFTIRYS